MALMDDEMVGEEQDGDGRTGRAERGEMTGEVRLRDGMKSESGIRSDATSFETLLMAHTAYSSLWGSSVLLLSPVLPLQCYLRAKHYPVSETACFRFESFRHDRADQPSSTQQFDDMNKHEDETFVGSGLPSTPNSTLDLVIQIILKV